MGLKEKLKFWEKGSKREIPLEDEWPISVKILSEDDFEDFIHKYPVTLIDFHSPHCGPCRAMSPKIRKLSKRYEKKTAFGKVNTRKNKALAEQYGVRSVPTIMIFKWGRRKKTIVGKRSMADIRNSLEDVL